MPLVNTLQIISYVCMKKLIDEELLVHTFDYIFLGNISLYQIYVYMIYVTAMKIAERYFKLSISVYYHGN